MIDERAERLLALLERLGAELRTAGDERWADWLARDAQLVRAGDAEGLRHFLSAFGGAGSLLDAHPSADLTKAYRLARDLRRDLDREADAPT